jgi:hypothetical protein
MALVRALHGTIRDRDSNSLFGGWQRPGRGENPASEEEKKRKIHIARDPN